MSDRVRTTISIDPEVLELFQRIAAASGISVSRCMGDWLSDTRDGAEHVFNQLQQARDASNGAIRFLHARLNTGELLDYIASNIADDRSGVAGVAAVSKPRERRPPRRQPHEDLSPASSGAPSSNTGLKSTGRGKSRSGGV